MYIIWNSSVKRFVPSLRFIYSFSHLFILLWTHILKNSLLDRNSILLLFIIFKMPQLFQDGSYILLTCNNFYLST